MKPIAHILWCLALLLGLASCSEGGKYVEHEGTICYTYWTFSFGQRYDTLPGVDPATFKSVNAWLGHDDKHVYFKDRLVDGAIPSAIKATKYPMSTDGKDYYYMHTPMGVADMATFEVLKRNDDDVWCKDSRYAYYDSLRLDDVDVATFKVTGWNVAIDSRHVYRYGKVLPLADPNTYVEDWKGLYSRDKEHIWYAGTLLEDVDYATFDVDKEGNAADKYGPFLHEKRDSTAAQP